LEGNGCIDGGSGRARAALRAEKREDARFARASASTSAVRTETGQGFEQSICADGLV